MFSVFKTANSIEITAMFMAQETFSRLYTELNDRSNQWVDDGVELLSLSYDDTNCKYTAARNYCELIDNHPKAVESDKFYWNLKDGLIKPNKMLVNMATKYYDEMGAKLQRAITVFDSMSEVAPVSAAPVVAKPVAVKPVEAKSYSSMSNKDFGKTLGWMAQDNIVAAIS